MKPIEGMKQRLRLEPFRLFFPLGVLFGLDGVATWWAYASRMSPVYHAYQHALIQVIVFVPAFVTGFFLTFLPRFTHTAPAGWGPIASLIIVLVAVDGLIHAGQWALTFAGHSLWVVLLLTFIMDRGRRAARRSRGGEPKQFRTPPVEMVWFPLGCLAALVSDGGMIMHHLGRLTGPWVPVFKAVAEQGLVFATVIGVAGFMVPRLTGSYEAASSATHPDRTPHGSPCSRVREGSSTQALFLTQTTAALLFFAGYPADVFVHPSMGALMKTLALLWVWYKARVWHRPRHGGTYVWGAYVSTVLFGAGMIGGVILPAYRIAWLHITFIGGVALMIQSIAHMITHVHAARADELNRFRSGLLPALGLTAAAMILRVYAVMDLNRYFDWLGAAALVWTAAWFVWLGLNARALLSFPPGDPFGEMHEKEMSASRHA